ncbi:hypothetical protein [Streptomyces sp. bgisy153]|uniref:hypothetical protein n=1 Tax=Streptomyces sp. bgisy153 TaxID=3413793 RepID=UPI003D72C0A8
MNTTLETYLGWEQPDHFKGCRRPQWTVDVRTDEDVPRDRAGGPAHECPQRYDTCGHGDRYTRTTVRVVCHSCGAAFVFRGEVETEAGGAKSATDGYGMPPRRLAGLLLWPGEPFLSWGRLSTNEPHDFVVTRPGVTRVTEPDVVGTIGQGRGARGGIVWTATALPSPAGPYGYGRLRWTCVSGEDSPLRSVAAAARWIAARLAEHDQEQAPAGGEGR